MEKEVGDLGMSVILLSKACGGGQLIVPSLYRRGRMEFVQDLVIIQWIVMGASVIWFLITGDEFCVYEGWA